MILYLVKSKINTSVQATRYYVADSLVSLSSYLEKINFKPEAIEVVSNDIKVIPKDTTIIPNYRYKDFGNFWEWYVKGDGHEERDLRGHGNEIVKQAFYAGRTVMDR